MNAAPNRSIECLDRRRDPTDYARRKVEYARPEVEGMCKALNDAQRKQMTRQFAPEPEPITAMGEFS
jgi:hypothetical protein